MDESRAAEMEARIADLEARLRIGARSEGVETAFWAVMHKVFPDDTRRHMKAAGREQLLAARAYLDHWIGKLDESPAAGTSPREKISVE